MRENLNLKLTVEAWADITIREWEKKIEALNIGLSMQLIDSFTHHIYSQADGDPSRIQFAFEWYGRMVEYGVGNGVNLEERDSMIAAGLTKRRPKPWFFDVFAKQLAVLRYVLEEKHARKVERLVVRNINDQADYGHNPVNV
jgi:hypothetical protein